MTYEESDERIRALEIQVVQIVENMEIMTEAMEKMGNNIQGNHEHIVRVEGKKPCTCPSDDDGRIFPNG